MLQPAVSTKMSGMLVSGIIITPGRSLINNIVSFHNLHSHCTCTSEGVLLRMNQPLADYHTERLKAMTLCSDAFYT